jgi:hypothetical protein
VPTKRWLETFTSFPDRLALANAHLEGDGITLTAAVDTMIQDVRRVDEIIKATNMAVAEELRAAQRHEAERRRRIMQLNSELSAGLFLLALVVAVRDRRHAGTTARQWRPGRRSRGPPATSATRARALPERHRPARRRRPLDRVDQLVAPDGEVEVDLEGPAPAQGVGRARVRLGNVVRLAAGRALGSDLVLGRHRHRRHRLLALPASTWLGPMLSEPSARTTRAPSRP